MATVTPNAWRLTSKTVLAPEQVPGKKKNSCVHLLPWTWRAGLTYPDLAWRDQIYPPYLWFGSLCFTVAFHSHKFLHSRRATSTCMSAAYQHVGRSKGYTFSNMLSPFMPSGVPFRAKEMKHKKLRWTNTNNEVNHRWTVTSSKRHVNIFWTSMAFSGWDKFRFEASQLPARWKHLSHPSSSPIADACKLFGSRFHNFNKPMPQCGLTHDKALGWQHVTKISHTCPSNGWANFSRNELTQSLRPNQRNTVAAVMEP